MKILVFFRQDNKNARFEGAKMKINIQSALEMNEITYTNELVDDYDVAHFISPKNEKYIDEIKARHIPVVVSALFGEDDPSTRFLDLKFKDGKRSVTISPLSQRTLEKADVIVVPSNNAKQLLLDLGINNRIEVVEPGVNLSRFDFSRDDEKELFYRYFNEDHNKQIVISVGEYTKNMDGYNALVKTAERCKNAHFYFFGTGYDNVKNNLKFKIFKAKSPKNLKWKEIVPEDIYRSAILNAKIFLVPAYSFAGLLALNDAMAGKCQIIARKSAILSDMLIDGETAYLADFSETITAVVKDYLDGKQKPTIVDAQKKIEPYNIEGLGRKLKKIYQNLLDNK
mgnify:FL=1